MQFKSLKVKLLIISGLATAALLAACSMPIQTSRVASQARPPIKITTSAALEKIPLDEMPKRATTIVVGRVEKRGQSQWNTPDGALSKETTVQNISPELTIFTDSEIAVEKTIKGEPVETLRVRTFGGTVGEDVVSYDSEPKLEPGQRYMLFLTQDDGNTSQFGPEHYSVLGAIQGVYVISDDVAISPVGKLPLSDLLSVAESNK